MTVEQANYRYHDVLRKEVFYSFESDPSIHLLLLAESKAAISRHGDPDIKVDDARIMIDSLIII